MIVNASFAQALWPGEDPLGRCLYIDDDAAPCSEIVGVVQDARRGSLVEETTYQYYMALVQRQANRRPEALLVRVSMDMQTTLARIQREMIALDSRVRFVRSMPMEDLVARELRQWRLGAAMFSLFGLLALVVAVIGLYSVLAFDVAQRVRDMLYGISPHDPVTFVVVAATLGTASMLAAAVPAWRAARVDPNVALRSE